jgi:hypothetical protein
VNLKDIAQVVVGVGIAGRWHRARSSSTTFGWSSPSRSPLSAPASGSPAPRIVLVPDTRVGPQPG